MKFLKRYFLPGIFLILLLAILPSVLKLVQTTQDLLTEALGQTANIMVDTRTTLGTLPRPDRQVGFQFFQT
ncbi:MAG: hypothetical protein Q8Q15_03515 [bacterium]|nr:hypothetical protein [bacterium]